MRYNKIYKHTQNGLVQQRMVTYSTGYFITCSIATGVDGESTCLIIRDTNCYPDDDSRSAPEYNREYIIPFDDTHDLYNLMDIIKDTLVIRNQTLIYDKEHIKQD